MTTGGDGAPTPDIQELDHLVVPMMVDALKKDSCLLKSFFNINLQKFLCLLCEAAHFTALLPFIRLLSPSGDGER